MNNKKRAVVAAIMSVILAVMSVTPIAVPDAWAQASEVTAQAAQNDSTEAIDVEPKFIWGILIKFIAGQAFSAFSSWVGNKLMEGASNSAAASLTGGGSSFSGGGMLLGVGVPLAIMAIQKLRAKPDTSGGAFIARNPTSIEISSKGAPPNIIGNPGSALSVSNDGNTNFQGMNVAVVGVGADGNIETFRGIKEGFKTGERIKLHVLSTFGGALVIENINPRGERKQIYPPEKDTVILLQAGNETLLPLGKNEYFQFTNTKGDEQLVITLRDPRAVGGAASKAMVYRKDEDYGTNFVQEVTPKTFPAISEAIRLQHN